MAEEEPKENALLTSIKLRIGIEDTKQDALLLDLIEDASSRVLAYINQDGPTTDDLPSSLGWVVKAVTIEMFNRIGDEGKQSGTEGNVSNTWAAIDLSQYADALDQYRSSSQRRRPGMRFV